MVFEKYSKEIQGILARIFDHTSTSFKFLFFHSILDSIKQGVGEVSFNDLAMKSLAYAYYSISFYKINFGTQDKIKYWIDKLKVQLDDRKFIGDYTESEIYTILKKRYEAGDVPLKKILDKFFSEFKIHVPLKLLSPWYPEVIGEKNDTVYREKILKHQNTRGALYKLEMDGAKVKNISIDIQWQIYIIENIGVVEGWWKYRFLEYLQKRNPTILCLANKLEPPPKRSMAEVHKLFKEFYNEVPGGPKCIYTQQPIQSISHDHFFPWSFLGDDPLYNFVPTSKSVNSSKGNRLPDKIYLEPVAKFQCEFFHRTVTRHKTVYQLYCDVLNVSGDFSEERFINRFTQFYEPLYAAASNQGFINPWVVE